MLLTTMVEIFHPFGLLFVACELGQRVNLAFDECKEIIGQFEWYRFPKDTQRMLPLILHFTQQPIDIKCFGSAALDRVTFKKVRFT